MADRNKLRQYTLERLEALRSDRSMYLDDWRDCSDFGLGVRAKFLSESRDRNKRERNEQLYNETAVLDSNILASGMMAGITSPSRPWFKLGTPDPDMMNYGPVKNYMSKVEMIMQTIFSRSNFYRSANDMYLELGLFGVASMGEFQNFENVARFENWTIGSYFLGLDGERNVDTIYREYTTTVGRVVKRFGIDNVSRQVKKLWEDNHQQVDVQVIHAIEPNDGRKFDSPLASDMPWRSVYYEKDRDDGQDSPLLISGFRDKPFMAPRWSVIGEDVYSVNYPCINSMGTNKALQIEELDKAIATEKNHTPPLVADASLMNGGLDLVAGGVTFAPNMVAMGKPAISPIYTVNAPTGDLRMDILDKEDRIHRHFFADLFMMLSNMDRKQITATEIAERKEEKLLMLGPVLERLNNEFLDPVIDRTFNIAQNAGILPPPPQELVDMDLKVEYISVLAQAQRAVSTASTEAVAAFVGNISQMQPEVLDKVDFDQMITEYAHAKGAPVEVIRDDDEVAAIRAQRQQAQQQQAAMAQAEAAAATAKTLSETETEEGNALDGASEALSNG